MADASAIVPPGQRRGVGRGRLLSLRVVLRALLTAGLIAAAVLAAFLVLPNVRTTGSLIPLPALSLGTSAPAHQVTVSGAIQAQRGGYRVMANGIGRVVMPLSLPVQTNARTLLRLWVYDSPQVETSAALVSADGTRQSLRGKGIWIGRTFDVTALAQRSNVRLELTSVNHLGAPVLFFDGAESVLAPTVATVTASTWSVALLVLLISGALLAVFGRLRHWPLAVGLAAFTALVWHRIPGSSLEALPTDSATLWNHAVAASWIGFHDGVLWGSWTDSSPLATQLAHTFIPIVGKATVSARSAALLTALLAVAAVYALGNRAAGRGGAVAAMLIALAATPLRDGAFAASALPALVLAGALLLYGLHACLARASPIAVALLAAGLSMAALANPLWLPGALVVLPVVVLLRGERGHRARALAAGLLVLLILVGPNLTSTAAQNNGNLLAGLDARAVAARNAEFAGGGRGAPPPAQRERDPLATGTPVTFGDYVFADHSSPQIVGSTLTGGHRALSAFASGPVLSAIAFGLALLGAIYVLIVPQLRPLVLVPIIVALPTLFVAGRIHTDNFAAGAVWWPVLAVSAAILVYAAAQLASNALASRRRSAPGRGRRPRESVVARVG